jgi:hypothetical protein
MNYYFINNDAVSLGGLSRREGWIRDELAFTGGAAEYHEQFRQLAPGDIILIYVNSLGVVAIGSVTGPWNGVADLVSVADEVPHEESEHRIRVYWLRDLRRRPLSLEKLHVIIGWTPRQSVQRISMGVERIQGLVADFQRNLDC